MNQHRISQQSSDLHFGNVGWMNVTVEIIASANTRYEMIDKEKSLT